MGNPDILNEIMINAKEVPLEYQERILDILRGMEFTKKCLLIEISLIEEQLKYEKMD